MFFVKTVLVKLADGTIFLGASLIILHGPSSVTIQTLEDSLLAMYFLTDSVLCLDLANAFVSGSE